MLANAFTETEGVVFIMWNSSKGARGKRGNGISVTPLCESLIQQTGREVNAAPFCLVCHAEGTEGRRGWDLSFSGKVAKEQLPSEEMVQHFSMLRLKEPTQITIFFSVFCLSNKYRDILFKKKSQLKIIVIIFRMCCFAQSRRSSSEEFCVVIFFLFIIF